VGHSTVRRKEQGIGRYGDEGLVNLGNLVNLVNTSTLRPVQRATGRWLSAELESALVDLEGSDLVV
jgi:hypothetical protein